MASQARDRQPQAKPLTRRVVAGVNLKEGFKDTFDMLVAEPDAGVGDVEADGRRSVELGMKQENREPDGALLGELDGVAQEVEENLAESDDIRVDGFGEFVGDVEVEREGFFLGAGAELFDGLPGDFARADEILGDTGVAHFRAGKIQDIVDEAQEVLGVVPDDIEEFHMFRGAEGVIGQ